MVRVEQAVRRCPPNDVKPVTSRRRYRQRVDPVSQNALDVLLREAEDIPVAGGEITQVQVNPVEARLPLREEPIGDSPLIEESDGSGVQSDKDWRAPCPDVVFSLLRLPGITSEAATLPHDPGLAASAQVRYKLKVATRAQAPRALLFLIG